MNEKNLEQIAKEFKERSSENVSVNDGYTKMTVYVRTPLAEAFNAYASERGMKKKYVNEMFERFILEKYDEMKNK